MNRQHTHINRDNYEIWFIDYMEHQLSETDNEHLQIFLLEHPDLAVELDNLTELTLEVPENISFPEKAILKKASAPLSELSAYDYQMVKAVEDGLSAPEHISMSTAATQTDWALYQKIRLQATPIAYPYKNKLKRKRITFLPAALRGLAAAILLLILFNVKDDSPGQHHGEKPLVAVTETSPDIDHKPLLSQPASVIAEAPESITEPDYLATANILNSEEISAQPSPKVNKETPATLPGPKITALPSPHLPNSYETGLRLMLPKYVENHQLMASLSNKSMPRMAEPNTKTLLNRTTDLIRQVSPFNLTYNKVYDEDGGLVAINLSGDNFEVAQKVPRWWGAR